MPQPSTLAALLVAGVALLGHAPAARGQEDPDSSPARPAVTTRFQVDWLSAVRGTSVRDSALDPGNERLRIPRAGVRTELRGDARVEAGSRLLLVFRPRVLASSEWASARGIGDTRKDEAEAHFTEAYVAWTPVDPVTITYGLQNFQWGPAELVAPNNRVFHETGVFRDPLYYVRGRHLLRLNLSAGRQWSIVGLAELGANGDEAFRAGERFARQGLAKVEFTTADGASYVGGTVGVTADAPGWVGAYGSLAITEGLSVYLDTSHTRGSQAWYPVLPDDPRAPPSLVDLGFAPAPGFARTQRSSGTWQTMAVTGARYTFSRGDDVRVEWLAQQAGWREGDLRLAAVAAAAATSPESFAPYLRPGLEFLGRQFLLVSLRTPELPPRKRVEVQTRYLHSLTDGSRLVFVTGRWEAADRIVVFASGTVTGGAAHGEFSRFARGTAVAGTSVTW